MKCLLWQNNKEATTMPKCPICNGTGIFDYEYGKAFEGLIHKMDCYGCEGEGEVKKIWEGLRECPSYNLTYKEMAKCVIWLTLSGTEHFEKKPLSQY